MKKQKVDIKVIRILKANISTLAREEDDTRHKIYQARRELERLEIWEIKCKENTKAAEASLNGYAPDWQKLLQRDFWKHY